MDDPMNYNKNRRKLIRCVKNHKNFIPNARRVNFDSKVLNENFILTGCLQLPLEISV